MYVYQVLGVLVKSISPKYKLFWAFFWLDTNTRRGVALLTFLKPTPGDTDSKYIWVCGYNWVHIFLEVFFGHFLALHTKRKGCGQDGPTPSYYSHNQVVCMPGFWPVVPFVFLAKGTILIQKIGMVIYAYLKHSPGDTDSKYIWVRRSNSTRSSLN